jgi:glycosyltransferase involved in cell wall biosynthesis
MFLSSVPEVVYVDPWTASFEDRLAALRKGSSRIVYFYERPDTSTFRYRVYNMIQALATSNADVSAAYFSQCEMDRLDQVIGMADVLVVCRSRYTAQLNRLITRAKEFGCRVLFDVDDLIFDTNYVHLILNTLDQQLSEVAWDFWFACIGRLGATLRLCDGVIVTNEYLASRVRHYADRETYVIPNFLNEEQIALSRHVFNLKRESGFARNEWIHLGYFSGTPTHNKDFEIIAGALARLMDSNPRLVLRIVGYLDLKGWLQEHGSRVEFYPLQDFLNLQRLIGSTEINLVPLQDNIFTNCKSELKYFEAGIVGTVTIASPTFSFRSAIQNGGNGFLANAHEWEERLSSLIDRLDDYSDIAARAFQHSEECYSWVNKTALIEKTLFD